MSKSPSDEFRLGIWDYVILVAVIGLTTAVGLYYAWRARKLTNTRDFLVTSRNIGVLPLVASTFATSQTSRSILHTPSDQYSNGLQMVVFHFAGILIAIFVAYAIVPVFYRLKLCTVYQYTEFRFNRLMRIIQALVFMLQNCIYMASLADLTAKIFSNATGLSYWWSMAVIFGMCAVFTSLGGFSSVIWTDFILAIVMLAFIVTLVVYGTIKMEGVSNVWNRNVEGDRATIFRFSIDNGTDYSFWSLVLSGSFMFLSYSFDQPTLQRCNANKTIGRALITFLVSRLVLIVVQLALMWIGMVNYARYYDCDPVLNGQIRSRDQITILFGIELFNGKVGLVGFFLAGIVAASISTISSVINSFSTVVMIDFVRIFYPDLKYWKNMMISKLSGIAYGAMIIAVTLIIDRFGSLIQVSFIVVGACYGPLSGVFILGLFFPWITTTGAYFGLFCSLAFVWWVCIGRLINRIPYQTLAMSTEGCAATSGSILNQTFMAKGLDVSEVFSQNCTSLATVLLDSLRTGAVAHSAGDVFPLYAMHPIWYTMWTMIIVIIVGSVVSLATGDRDPEKVDPRLISPFWWFILNRLSVKSRKWLGYKSNKYLGDFRISAIWESAGDYFMEKEMESLKLPLPTEVESTVYNNNFINSKEEQEKCIVE